MQSNSFLRNSHGKGGWRNGRGNERGMGGGWEGVGRGRGDRGMKRDKIIQTNFLFGEFSPSDELCLLGLIANVHICI